MPIIPKELIERIRFASNIVEVVGSYLPALKRRGSTFKCNCPFHQEKTPSFTVNETRQIFHCFGCGAGGDVFRFVMDYEKVDFVTAVKILADRSNIEVVYEGGSSEKSGNKDELYKIHRDAAAFYHRLLLNGEEAGEARRYLEERDLPMEVVKEFQIGYAPSEWDGLLKRALKKGYKGEHLEQAGLVVPSERGHYDRFRNRIMFPICDHMGRVIGFSGRIMNQAEKGAKYVNSPETLLFHKSRVLFAFDKARKPIVESRQAVVVEGQIDAIRCHQYGINNVVASQGTALTEEHAKLVKRYADEVVLVLDADAAGMKAAMASSEIFIANELSVRVGTMPAGEDPDSLIRKEGAGAFRRLVEQAGSALDYLLACLGKTEDMSTEAGRMRVLQAALNLIKICPAATRRDAMIRRTADVLNLSETAVLQDLRREWRKERSHPVARAQETPPPPIRPKETQLPEGEVALLELLVHHYPAVHPLVHDYLPGDCFTDPTCKEVLEVLMVDLPETLNELFHEVDEKTQRLISRVQVQETRTIDAETLPIEAAQSYIIRFWSERFKRELSRLNTRTDLAAHDKYLGQQRLKYDLATIAKGWDNALPVIEKHLAG
jgi:DNA primase